MNDLCVFDLAAHRFLAYDAPGGEALAWTPPEIVLQAGLAPSIDRPLEELPFVTLRDRVAFLRISGFIRAESVWWSSQPGLEKLGQVLLRLGERDGLREIVLHVTSRGGSVETLEDFSAVIAAVARHKRVRTFASGCMLSAAYWFGCQVEEILCDPLALIGSLGVFTVLIDASAQAKEIGLRRIVVSSGGIKGMDFRDDVPRELQAEHERLVMEQAGLFRAAVARGRGLDEESLAALFDGRSQIGESARERGLVDRVLTFPAFCDELAAGKTTFTFSSPQSQPSTPTPTEDTMSAETQEPEVSATAKGPEPTTQPAGRPPAESAESASVIGQAVAAAFRYFWRTKPETSEPEPVEPQAAGPAVGETERRQLIAACANELLVATGRELASSGVRLLPGHLKTGGAAEAFAAATARELLAGTLDATKYPATALARSRLGAELTVQALFPSAPPVQSIAQAWGSLAQPAPDAQPNLAQPTAATESLIPQGQAEASVTAPESGASGLKGWGELSADQRTVLEGAGVSAETYAEYQSYVAESGGAR